MAVLKWSSTSQSGRVFGGVELELRKPAEQGVLAGHELEGNEIDEHLKRL